MSESQELESSTPKPAIKHDWYQTDSHVTVNVLVKNQDKDKVKVVFGDNSLTIYFDQSGESFHLNLAKTIDSLKCSYRITPTKIEVKLKKLNEELWIDLEGKTPDSKDTQTKLTSTKRDWDKLVETELKDDPAQGEAALNELFQKIYTEGSDEVKKAMNKSFLESGGTVLSTNWNEVGEKKVDIKPPDGMEWKKWED